MANPFQMAIPLAAVSLVMVAILPAQAQNAGVALRTKDIETSVTADFDGDRLADYAMLVRSKDSENGAPTTRFQVYLRLPNANQTRFRRIIDEEVGFDDKLTATLRLNPRGSVVLRSTYAASGAGDNETWTRTLTMQVRNAELVVIGYAHASGERISGKVEFSCDINLLTQSGLRNGKPVKVSAKPIPARSILADDSSVVVPGCEE